MHEVEQVVEPAARIGRRPTVKFGLHLRYPPTRTHRSSVGWSATVRWCVFRHYSLHPFSKLLPPFPLCTGFPPLRVLRRLRPVPSRSVDDGPSRPAMLGAWRQAGIETVPTFTVIRSTKEEPNSVPAASPRLPRSTSPWPPKPAPTSQPESSLPNPRRAGAHRARPLSTRFEPVYLSRDVITPVPRVLLFVTPAEPAPSGSAGTSRRCRGCSYPPRHLPDQAAPSFTVPAATGPAAKVSHLHSNHQRLVAHEGCGTGRRCRRSSPQTTDHSTA